MLTLFLRFIVLGCLAVVSSTALAVDEELDFARDVRPILSDRCYFCHGPDGERREADLRLDSEEAAHEWAIVPGSPEESELIRRIQSDDPEEVMPPPESKLELSVEQRNTLQRWVQQGAKYESHWAFSPVSRPALAEAGSHAKPIDGFVEARLKQLNIAPQPRADRVTLMRRVYLDLTGLPPTIEEVDAYLADQGPEAYERLVERLLKSERFGERMAVDWLDVARYADTYGYQNDRYRPMWPWRDWVVRAFNNNLPYDQFITWQLAGDMLPDPTQEQVLATAFNRNHRQTNEGGSVEEEFRAEYVADRVNTFGAAFLGLTLECCRCHDHKYDPITQKEYYQFAAFFNSIDESGLYSHFTQATPTPTLELTDEQQAEAIADVQRRLADLESQLDSLKEPETDYQNWRNALKDVRPSGNVTDATISLADALEETTSKALVGDYPFDEVPDGKVLNRKTGETEGKLSNGPELIDGVVGKALTFTGDNSVTVPAGGDFTRNQPFTLSFWLIVPNVYERAVILHRSRAWTDSGSRGYELLVEDGKLSAALIHFWPGNAIRVRTAEQIAVDRWMKVDLSYDGSSTASGLQIYVDGESVELEVVRDRLTKHIIGSDGFGGGDTREVSVGERFRDKGLKGGAVDELKVFDRALTALELKTLYVRDARPANLREVLHNAEEHLLRDYFRSSWHELVELQTRLRAARDELKKLRDPLPEIMVMSELSTPRPTHLLVRGAYDARGELVDRGVPEGIYPADLRGGSRLDLAKWLTDAQHPLTARVAVNRFWQALFGRGLVATSEDFGLQGAMPTHPELLDWLAAEFVESGWDVKRLLKTIVTSDTYCRSSNPTAQLLEIDPDNELLARGPVVRLPAEMIRDAALLAGDLLVEELGGPPVKPYQPSGLWKEKSGSAYVRDEGVGSHRRSLYTYWKRTSPPPSMMTLDASNREVCVVKRQVTMTPLQMLVLLNDPQYVEAAKAVAEQAMTSATNIPEKLSIVFRSLTSRQPTSNELRVLSAMFEQQRVYFEGHAGEADKLLAVGDHKPDQELEQITLAALTTVAEGLMTYDETVVKR